MGCDSPPIFLPTRRWPASSKPVELVVSSSMPSRPKRSARSCSTPIWVCSSRALPPAYRLGVVMTDETVVLTEPLAVPPREACRLLSVGLTRLYELLHEGQLESFRYGRSRRIT